MDRSQKVASAPSLKFKALDTDHDEYISQVEAQADPAVASAFANLDANHDQLLSETEFSHVGVPVQWTIPLPGIHGNDDRGHEDGIDIVPVGSPKGVASGIGP